MNKIIIFIVLVGIALYGGMIVGREETDVSVSGIRKVDVAIFQNELSDDVVVLDIRTPEEYASGKIAGAINLDFYSSDFENQLAQLDKTKEYKIYCNSGNRSSSALSMMRDMGFSDVSELSGGIQSWKANGLPVCTNC